MKPLNVDILLFRDRLLVRKSSKGVPARVSNNLTIMVSCVCRELPKVVFIKSILDNWRMYYSMKGPQFIKWIAFLMVISLRRIWGPRWGNLLHLCKNSIVVKMYFYHNDPRHLIYYTLHTSICYHFIVFQRGPNNLDSTLNLICKSLDSRRRLKNSETTEANSQRPRKLHQQSIGFHLKP